MLDLSALENEHRNQLFEQFPWVWLFSVSVPDGAGGFNRYRFTNYTEAVDFGTASGGGPLTYLPFVVFIDALPENTEGNVEAVTLTVGAITGELMDNLNAYDGLIGQEVVIRVVNAEALATNVPTLEQRLAIRGAKIGAGGAVATFALSVYGVAEAAFPGRRVTRNRCAVRFGGPECGYVIPASPGNTVGTGFDFCPRILASCDERGDDEEARAVPGGRLHPERFNAYRSTPRRRARRA